MGMTMTQKILAAHAGLESVKAGQFINIPLDVVMRNDVSTAVALMSFDKAGFDKVFDRGKIVLVILNSRVFIPMKVGSRQAQYTVLFASLSFRPFDVFSQVAHNVL